MSTIGLDETKIRKYVQYQEDKERQEEGYQEESGLFKPPVVRVRGLLSEYTYLSIVFQGSKCN